MSQVPLVDPQPPAGVRKDELRRRLRAARRSQVPGRDREEDGRALAEVVLAALGDLRSALPHGTVCRVAAYEARPTEPPTQELIRRLVETGCDVVVPVTRPDHTLDWAVTNGGEHPAYGEQVGDEALAEATLVVTPGLAVDAAGTRLGQGGGSYDRALAHRRPGTPVVTLLWDDELLGTVSLPREEHDLPVDAVVTPGRGWVWLSRGSAR